MLTVRARKVFLAAAKEATRLNHDYIGTEHILLGLTAIGEGVAVEVLKSMNVNFVAVKYITDIIGQNSREVWLDKLRDSREALKEFFA